MMMQALQKSQVDLAEEYSTEKKEVKKEMKRLQAQLATSQKEKVDLADNHKASHFSSLPVVESI
jgi:predicted glycoside hydrolase/deacetylase ChbG (UPF0249 family)